MSFYDSFLTKNFRHQNGTFSQNDLAKRLNETNKKQSSDIKRY